MFEACVEKQENVKKLFADCRDEQARYERIIELGRKQPKLDVSFQTTDNLVRGCQSLMYMRTSLQDNLLFFEAASEALISAGLAALLIQVYSGETAETILKCPPNYIEELGITASLTPNRANGLYSIHLRMKQDALRSLVSPK